MKYYYYKNCNTTIRLIIITLILLLLLLLILVFVAQDFVSILLKNKYYSNTSSNIIINYYSYIKDDDDDTEDATKSFFLGKQRKQPPQLYYNDEITDPSSLLLLPPNVVPTIHHQHQQQQQHADDGATTPTGGTTGSTRSGSTYYCSVVIYGTTPAGIVAAIAASRTFYNNNNPTTCTYYNHNNDDDADFQTTDNNDTTTTTNEQDYDNPIICLVGVSNTTFGGMMAGGLGITDIGGIDANTIIGGITKEFFIYNTIYYRYCINNDSNTNRCSNYIDFIATKNSIPTINTTTNLIYNVEPHVAEFVFRTIIYEENIRITDDNSNSTSNTTRIQLMENTGPIETVQYHTTNSTNASIPSDNNNDSSDADHPLIQSITTTYGYELYGKVYIDASYEGDLLHVANITLSLGRENRTTYNESYNGNIRHNDGHQFVVPVNPYQSDSTTTTTTTFTNNDYSNATNNDRVLLPYLVTGYDDDATSGIGESNKIQAYTFRLCVTNDSNYRIPFPGPTNYEAKRWELYRRYIQKLNEYNITETVLQIPTANTHRLLLFDKNNVKNYTKYPKYDCNNGGAISTDYVGGSWTYPTATYTEREIIWEQHKQYMLELFYFLRTDPIVPLTKRNEMKTWGLCSDEFIYTNYWPSQLYVRESYRLLGDYVWNQNHIQQQHKQRSISIPSQPRQDVLGINSIGVGSYNYDSHTIQRIVCTNCSLSFSSTSNLKFGGYAWNEGDLEQSPAFVYQIPMDVVFPKRREVQNLISPTCPSTTHVTFNTIRMEPQFMIIGQASGVIAALYYRTNCYYYRYCNHQYSDDNRPYQKQQQLTAQQHTPIQSIDRIQIHNHLLQMKQIMS